MQQLVRYAVAALTSLLLVSAGAVTAQAAPSGVGNIRVEFSTPEGVPGLLTLADGSQRLVATKAGGGTAGAVELSAPSGRYALTAKPVMAGTKRYVAVADPLRNIQVMPNATTRVRVTYVLSQGLQEIHQVGLAPDSVTLTWNAPAGTSVQVRRTVGDVAATSPAEGVAVATDGSGLMDRGLQPGTRYTYSFWAKPGDSALGVDQNAGPVTLTVGTTDPARPDTASYVVKPGTLLARADQVVAARPTGDGVQVVLAGGIDTPAPGSAVVLPVSDELRGGFLGVVTNVSPDGRTLLLSAGGLADAFDYYHLRVADLGALPMQRLVETDHGDVVAGPALAEAPVVSDEAQSGVPQDKTRPTRSSRSVQTGPAPMSAASLPSAPMSAASLPSAPMDAPANGDPECKKFSVTGEGINFDPGFQLAGHFETTVDKYRALGVDIPTGVSLDTQAAVTLSGAVTAKVTATYACSIKLPSVMVPLPSGPVPMAFYFKPTARMGVSGAIQVSNLGAAATLGFQADGYVGFNGESHLNGDLVNEAHPLTPQLDNVAGGLTAKVGGDVLIGPGAGSTGAGVIVGLGGSFVPMDAKALVVVPTTEGGSPCLSLDLGGQIGVLVSARAWLGWVDFKADLLVPGLSQKFSYLPEPWHWPSNCQNVPDPSDDVLGDGVTKVDDGVDGDPEQWGYLDGFTKGSKAWVLSTGYIAQATGHPGSTASTDLGGLGNSSLSAYSGYGTYDAAAYRVKLIPTGDTLHVRYAFASEEFPEWVGSQYNDVMAVFVGGQNCAFVPGTNTPVSINSINDHTNAQYYVDNSTGASGYQTSFDGLTTPLQCSVPVAPGVPIEVEIAVADASDGILDSAVALLDKGIWSD